MNNIVHWMRVDDSALGREKLEGQTATNSLAEPMMLTCLIDQLLVMDPSLESEYTALSKWCIEQIFSHIQVQIFFQGIWENVKFKISYELLYNIYRNV